MSLNIIPKHVICQVQRVNLLTPKMLQVILHFETLPDFYAGQYLLLHIDINGENKQLPYSIANAPAAITGCKNQQLELYIANHSELEQQLMAQLTSLSTLSVEMPFGECCIRPDWLQQRQSKALIMLASGSGFSQIKSLCEAVFAINPKQEVHIYWSNAVLEDFYLHNVSTHWEQNYPNCYYHPVLQKAKAGWQGKNGYFHDVIAQDFTQLQNTEVFACGSPNMVYTTLDSLQKMGLTQANMHSDVFAYAPRENT